MSAASAADECQVTESANWYDESVTIEAWIDESAYSDLTVGSRALISLLGLNEDGFSGRVRWLGVVTDEELKAASFSVPVAKLLAQARWIRAEIELDRPDRRLLPGLTVEVFVERQRRIPRLLSAPRHEHQPLRAFPPPPVDSELRGEITPFDGGVQREHSL
jgi:hypothetical protein